MPLTCATYNIHWGVGRDGRLDLSRIVSVLREQNVQVACLQEVHDETVRSNFTKQTEKIAAGVGFAYICFAPTMQGYPQNPGSAGSYGNAIISCFPIEIRGVLCFKTASKREPRNAMAVTIQTPSGPLRLVNVHLGADILGREQECSVRQLLCWEYMRNTDIICGDFNYFSYCMRNTMHSSPWRDAWLLVGCVTDEDSKTVKNNATPYNKCGYLDGTTFCCRRLDYIFILPETIIPHTVHVLQQCTASDHSPVILTFDLKTVFPNYIPFY